MEKNKPYDTVVGEFVLRNLTGRRIQLIQSDGASIFIEANPDPLVAWKEERPVRVMLPFSATFRYYMLSARSLPSKREDRLYIATEDVAQFARRDDILCADPEATIICADGTLVVTSRLISFAREREFT